MSNIEFRFVHDCETLEKVLQYRFIADQNLTTEWKTVPTVLGVVKDGVVVVPTQKP